jgi:hypothetical protein
MKLILIAFFLVSCGSAPTEQNPKETFDEFLEFFQGERGEDEPTAEEKDGITVVNVCDIPADYSFEEIVVRREVGDGRLQYYKYFKNAPPERLNDGQHAIYGTCDFIVNGNEIIW